MHLACWIELHSFTSSPLAVMLSWHLRQLSCGLFKDIYQGWVQRRGEIRDVQG